MTPQEYRAKILAAEADAQAKIDVLSTVPARARPSAGESGAIADAVAAMAKRQQNAKQIEAVLAELTEKTESIEREFYEGTDIMTVRAKMRCWHRQEHGETTYAGKPATMRSYQFTAVCSDDPASENKVFYEATPSATFTISVANPNVDFEQGAEYYFDITKAEPAEA